MERSCMPLPPTPPQLPFPTPTPPTHHSLWPCCMLLNQLLYASTHNCHCLVKISSFQSFLEIYYTKIAKKNHIPNICFGFTDTVTLLFNFHLMLFLIKELMFDSVSTVLRAHSLPLVFGIPRSSSLAFLGYQPIAHGQVLPLC